MEMEQAQLRMWFNGDSTIRASEWRGTTSVPRRAAEAFDTNRSSNRESGVLRPSIAFRTPTPPSADRGPATGASVTPASGIVSSIGGKFSLPLHPGIGPFSKDDPLLTSTTAQVSPSSASTLSGDSKYPASAGERLADAFRVGASSFGEPVDISVATVQTGRLSSGTYWLERSAFPTKMPDVSLDASIALLRSREGLFDEPGVSIRAPQARCLIQQSIGATGARSAPPTNSPEIRVHAELSEGGLRVWLGIDVRGESASKRAQNILGVLLPLLRGEGVQVSEVICNGLPLPLATLGAGGPASSRNAKATEGTDPKAFCLSDCSSTNHALLRSI